MTTDFTFLFECSTSADIQAILAQALLHNFKILPLGTKDLNVLKNFATRMAQGRIIPAGSREFVLSAIKAAGLKVPENLDYVPRLQWAYNRKVVIDDKGDLADNFAFQDARTWRYYVLNSELVGVVELDRKSPQSVLNPFCKKPSDNFIFSCLECFFDSHQEPHAYALDVALVDDTFGLINSAQKEVLVKINDAWGLSMHPNLKDKSAFLDMLIFRWQEIVRESRQDRKAISQKVSCMALTQNA